MARLTLSVPEELKSELESAGLNMSELFRSAAVKKLHEFKLAMALERLLEEPEKLNSEASQLAVEIKSHPERFPNKGEALLKLLDVMLKHSKMTDELALKLGDELKERVAKRHRLI